MANRGAYGDRMAANASTLPTGAGKNAVAASKNDTLAGDCCHVIFGGFPSGGRFRPANGSVRPESLTRLNLTLVPGV
jgi:hypothetical protein